MSQLRSDFNTELEAIKSEWQEVNNSTKAKLSSEKNYFTDTKNGKEAAQKAVGYKADLKGDFDIHAELAARGKNIRRDLAVQVQSSENHVIRMDKYGKPAAFFFAILGAVIGGAIGFKVPAGLGQVAAIAVGAIVGFIGFGLVGLFLYCIYQCRYKQQRHEWQQYQHSNQRDIEMIDEITRKRSGLHEIRSQLGDLEEGNMVNARPVLVQKMSEYLS